MSETETKHTEGPWRLDGPEYEGVASDDYHLIDAGRGYHPYGFGLSGCMSLADARLIAAAPDMLDALLRLRLDARPTNWKDGDDPELTAAWRALDDALAKAVAP